MKRSLLVCLIAGMLISSSPAADAPSGAATPALEGAITNSAVPAPALTGAQRAGIRAEEIYRSEVRQELDAKADEAKSSTDRLWTALNSSFVLWLLSSVVVSGIAAGYTGWQNHHAKTKANRELIEKLDTEISNRIYEALGATRSYEGSIRNNSFSEPKAYYSLMLNYLNNNFPPAYGPDFSIFPDLKACGFRSVVTMLYDSLQSSPANRKKAAELKEVLVIYEKFANLGSILETNPDMSKENLLRVILEIRETISTRILKDRWRKDDLY
ncbi:MAG: hypothetical protein WBN75_01675 [Verrucomicrobiia bacterium]